MYHHLASVFEPDLHDRPHDGIAIHEVPGRGGGGGSGGRGGGGGGRREIRCGCG